MTPGVEQIRAQLALNENQWTYNVVPAIRDDAGYYGQTFDIINPDTWLTIRTSKLDVIFPVCRATHRFIVRGTGV